jgi:hypothetical protein
VAATTHDITNYSFALLMKAAQFSTRVSSADTSGGTTIKCSKPINLLYSTWKASHDSALADTPDTFQLIIDYATAI